MIDSASLRDPGAAFRHALATHAAAAGVRLEGTTFETSAWASATFVGHRHRIAFVATGDAAAAWAARLPEAEWSLPDRLVADIAVDHGAGGAIVVHALLLDDHRPTIDS